MLSETDMKNIPNSLFCSIPSGGHVQGIALDTEHNYMYVSLTTALAKVDMQGAVIGYVEGLTGHLGSIAFNGEDGKIYGSLEYKHDAIGKDIIKNINASLADEDAFYVAIFDAEKIDRPGLDAEKDGIMTAVYLNDVVNDYSAVLPDGKRHRYGCSGIDGLSFGPVFGKPGDSEKMLFVAYGIYGDKSRTDNDCQIILEYDWRAFSGIAKPLLQSAPHHEGIRCTNRYFLYTGNTDYGIQNLEYDAFNGDWLAAVYQGQKAQFPNYPMFVIDGSVAAKEAEIPGQNGEKGLMLSLKTEGIFDPKTGIWGVGFGYGQTGIHSFGNGYFYFSHDMRVSDKQWGTTARLYRRNGTEFELIV